MNQRFANDRPEGPAATPLSFSHIGAAWPTIALDDFGIIGTHHLPLDWVGGGDVVPAPPEDFSY